MRPWVSNAQTAFFGQNNKSQNQATQATEHGSDILSQLPAIVNYHEVLQIVVMALGLSFAATIYPSWRAAKLDPVEALRYE